VDGKESNPVAASEVSGEPRSLPGMLGRKGVTGPEGIKKKETRSNRKAGTWEMLHTTTDLTLFKLKCSTMEEGESKRVRV